MSDVNNSKLAPGFEDRGRTKEGGTPNMEHGTFLNNSISQLLIEVRGGKHKNKRTRGFKRVSGKKIRIRKTVLGRA